MGEAKFTPGPWGLDVGFDSSRPGDFDEYWQVHDGQDAIACSSNCYSGNREANARLIAAAPELYEALDGLLKTLSECGVELDCMSAPTTLIKLLNTEKEEAVVNAARAALAKARGANPTP